MDLLQELKGFDAGHQLALIKACGGRDYVDAVLRGDLTIELKKAIKALFDKHGRRIPKNLQTSVCDANRDFRLDQPKLNSDTDYANRIMRLHGCLGVDTGITTQQLKAETERLLLLIMDNSQIINIGQGVWLPVVLPQLTTDDLGTALDQYLKGVGKSYVKTFNNREFSNCSRMTSNVSIVDGSRHNQLIERMRQGPVIGIHFPNSLQGFSINASREQMSTLPKGFILSGIDTFIAMAMYPDILARDYNTPGLDIAALSWWSARSLFFQADNDGLAFASADDSPRVGGNYSGGLFFTSLED